MMVMTERSTIERHPDIMALRMRYEEVAETPTHRLVGGLTLLSGIYAAISPWVIGFDNLTSLAVSNLVCGLTVAVIALGWNSAFERTHGVSWTLVILGAWIGVSQWLVRSVDASQTNTIVNNLIIGGLILLCGLAAMGLSQQRRAQTPAAHVGR
jgi:hypothetical protein